MVGKQKNPIKLFTMVRRAIWRSKRFKDLPNDDCRYLYFYFLTCPQQTKTGCFQLLEAYALGDLAKRGSNWTAEKYRNCKAEIIKSELILADDETDEILITRWWQDHPPNNDDWLKGAERQCEAIEAPTLRTAAQEALKAAWEAFLASKLAGATRGPNAPTPLPTGADRLNALARKL